MAVGPLAGLRVIELTDDTGRFAGKMLAETGASVAQVVEAPPFAGPPMRDAAAAARGGLLDWWYDGGKRRVPLDLGTTAGQDAYRALAQHADLVIETQPPGRLAELGLDHADLVAANPALVQVSLTPFESPATRFDAPEPNATCRPSAEREGVRPLAAAPPRPMLTQSTVVPVKLAIDGWYLDRCSPWLDMVVGVALLKRFLPGSHATRMKNRAVRDVPQAMAPVLEWERELAESHAKAEAHAASDATTRSELAEAG